MIINKYEYLINPCCMRTSHMSVLLKWELQELLKRIFLNIRSRKYMLNKLEFGEER